MKLAFTTLGCPKWDMETIISKAVEYGYDGVDFRGYLGEMDIYKLPEFSTAIEATTKKFKAASLEVPCFSSSIRLFTASEEQLQNDLEELRQYARLCNEFGTAYIRVFGGHIKEKSRSEAIATIIKNVQDMLKIAEEHQVCLLVETHDDWTNCEYIAEIIQKVDSTYLQVLWDVHHPYRIVHESPTKTWDVLGEHIKYTHWKDSYLTEGLNNGYQLCLLGEGDIPLQSIYKLLQDKGYSGYYTLEWEKVWWPAIEEPEIAFQAYTKYMSALAEQYRFQK